MFDSTKQWDRGNEARVLVSLAISLAVHFVMICGVLILPLLFFNAIQQEELLTLLYVPPPLSIQPTPPPIERVAIKTTMGIGSVNENIKYAPESIPKGIVEAPDEPANLFRIERIIPDNDWGEQTRSATKAIETLITAPPKLPELKRPEEPKAVKMGGQVLQSKCIFRFDPVYPELARRARISGTVVLEAVVDEEGNVSELRVLRGHPLLIDAALQAVKQWKYSPTILNGEPVQVLATITVDFRLR